MLLRVCFTLALWLALTQAAGAQDARLIQVALTLPDGLELTHVATGDIDGDGLVDVVASQIPAIDQQPPRHAVIVLRQIADPPGFALLQTLPAQTPRGLALTDIDGDGDLDIALAQGINPPLAIYLNQGAIQGGIAGHFRPSTQGLDLPAITDAIDVLAIDADARAETPDDLLLLRENAGSRPALLRNQSSAQQIALGLWQYLDVDRASAATVYDSNGDGRDDLFLARPCTIAEQRGPDAEPPFALIHVPICGILPNHLRISDVLAIPISEDPRRHAIALASDSGLTHGAFWLPQIGPGPDFDLRAMPGGGQLALIDVDGNGLDDLVSSGLEGTELSATILRRSSPTQFVDEVWSELPGARDAKVVAVAGSNRLLLARQRTRSTFFGSGLPASQPPVLRFEEGAYTSRVGAVPAPLYLSAGLSHALSVNLNVIAPNQFQAPDLVAIPANHLRPQPEFVFGELVGTWTLQIQGTSPANTVIVEGPSEKLVDIVPDLLEESGFNCFLFAISQLTDFFNGVRGASNEIVLLQRLRDERLLATAAGSHYATLYAELQPALWRATFHSPLFLGRLRPMKDAWMPAVVSLVDGDGSAPISVEMLQLANDALDHYELYGDEQLRAAIARERLALDLPSLVGRPVMTLQQRWEASPMFRDGFD